MENILQRTRRRYSKYKSRHQNILNAAITVFNLKGFKGATIAEISAQAEVNEAMIYQHFKDKKHLFTICFETLWNELLTSYRELYKKYGHEEVIYFENLTKFWFHYMLANPDKSMFFARMLAHKDDEDLFPMFERYVKMNAEGIRRILERAKEKGHLHSAIDTDILAMAYANQSYTLIAMRELLGPERPSEDSFVQLMKNLVCIG